MQLKPESKSYTLAHGTDGADFFYLKTACQPPSCIFCLSLYIYTHKHIHTHTQWKKENSIIKEPGGLWMLWTSVPKSLGSKLCECEQY